MINQTKVFFVRHAQPDRHYSDDRTRPLTAEGDADTKIVLETLREKKIDLFYSSPYKRSIDTIRSTAAFYGEDIVTDERFRERECGEGGNTTEMFRKRWSDYDFCEPHGESLNMVQRRNIEALNEILSSDIGKNIVIGTHGTALSTIMNYYNKNFGCEDFMRIIDWMPYIVELDFNRTNLIGINELAHIYKEFKI